MFPKRLFPVLPQPVATSLVMRLLVVTIISLALAAGYFHTVLEQERKRYLRLEDAYVRVRSELGPDETQRLIDQSRLDKP